MSEQKVNWDTVDWSQRDASIAIDRGISPQRVSQVRANRNAPHPIHKNVPRRCVKAREWVQNNTNLIQHLTIKELAEQIGVSLASAQKYADQYGVTPKSGYHYHIDARVALMNFDLPSIDLSIAWRLKIHAGQKVGQSAAKIRSMHSKGPPKWDGRSCKKGRTPEHEAAFQLELSKAESYYKATK